MVQDTMSHWDCFISHGRGVAHAYTHPCCVCVRSMQSLTLSLNAKPKYDLEVTFLSGRETCIGMLCPSEFCLRCSPLTLKGKLKGSGLPKACITEDFARIRNHFFLSLLKQWAIIHNSKVFFRIFHTLISSTMDILLVSLIVFCCFLTVQVELF